MGPISVLVVDDHVLFAEAVQARLRRESDLSPVDVACSSDEACTYLTFHRPDIIVLDLFLGDASGLELAGYVREESPGAAVIILTGVESVDAVADALRLGVRGWLPKTVDGDHLVRAIRAVRRGEVWLPPDLLGQVIPRLAGSRPAAADPLGTLTSREREVLQHLVDGLGRAEIAARLHLSLNTVRTHVQNVLAKLGTHSTLESVALAQRHGMRASISDINRPIPFH